MVFVFRGKIIAEYDRDYRHDETNFRLEHYIDLIERKPRSVYDAAPVKKTIPKQMYEFILTLDKPKEIIRILRCYLNDPDAAMKAIPAANYGEFLVRYELVTGKEKSHSAFCTSVNISVSPPQLDPYDALLRKGVI